MDSQALRYLRPMLNDIAAERSKSYRSIRMRLLARLYFCGRGSDCASLYSSLDPLFVCNRDEGEEEPVVAHRSRTRAQKTCPA